MSPHLVDVSIIIPFLNEEDSVALVIKALAAQSKSPSEIIFIDAGSTDSSTLRITECQKKYSSLNIKVINHSPAYPGKARNAGVRACKSELIAFLDCGLVPKKDWLNEVYESFIANSSLKGVWSSCYYEGATPLETLICAYSFGQGTYYQYFLASSIFHKSIFSDGTWFREDLRAAEDTIWRNQVMAKYQTTTCEKSNVEYTHFPSSFKNYLKKWKLYSQFISLSGVSIKQEMAYFTFFILVIITPFISLNLTALILTLYILMRGFLDPIRRSKKILWFRPYYFLFFIGPLFVFISDFYKIQGFIKGRFFGSNSTY